MDNLRAQVKETDSKKKQIEQQIQEISERLQAPGGAGLKDKLVDAEGYPRADIDIPQTLQDRKKLAELMNDHKSVMKELDAQLIALYAKQKELGNQSSTPKDSQTPVTTPPNPTKSTDSTPGSASRRRTSQPRAAVLSVPFGQTAADITTPPSGQAPPPEPAVDVTQIITTSDMLNSILQEIPHPFAKIGMVSPSSPADQAGLQPGDQLCRFGSVVRGPPHTQILRDMLEVVRANEDKDVDVTVLRGKKVQKLTIVPRTWSGTGRLGCHVIPVPLCLCGC